MEGSEGTPSGLAISKDMLYGIVIVLLAALFVASIMTQGFGIIKPTGQDQTNTIRLSDTALKNKLESYINQNLLPSGNYSSEVTSITKYDAYLNSANVSIKQGGIILQTAIVYINNDGTAIFLGQVFKTNESLNKPASGNNGTSPPSQITQTSRPKAEVFIMAFCPFGLQFLKAYVPVMELLGDKADLEVHFVDYAMHGKKELDGNNYIYCAQKTDKAKFPAYLRCFVQAGDYQGCVATAGLSNSTIQTCIAQVDSQYNISTMYQNQSTWAGGRYPRYPVETSLNDQYGVQGSPTFVVNGKGVDINVRSSEKIKQAICAAFTQPPAECQTVLSSTEESPGVGAIGSGSGASTGDASCG